MAAPQTLSDAALLENTLTRYASIPYAHGDLQGQTVFDREHNRYLLMTVGWDGDKRVHSVVVDVELKDGKFWIHRDGLEEGIAADLEENGIPKERIVLAWFQKRERALSGYAIG
jgi:XisI protein